VRRALTLAVLLAAPAASLAAVALDVSVEWLARDSDAVVRGTVTSRAAAWAGDGKKIFTTVRVRVSEVWAGSAPGNAELELVVPGGEVGEWGQRVSGAPAFADGEEVVVFLRRDGKAAFRVNGLALGKFRVEAGQARPTVDQVHRVGPAPPRGERTVEPMPLEELSRRVRGARR
jgi:hypothetical protein